MDLLEIIGLAIIIANTVLMAIYIDNKKMVAEAIFCIFIGVVCLIYSRWI